MSRFAWIAGAILQGLALGGLVFLAITRVMAAAGLGFFFRYEGF